MSSITPYSPLEERLREYWKIVLPAAAVVVNLLANNYFTSMPETTQTPEFSGWFSSKAWIIIPFGLYGLYGLYRYRNMIKNLLIPSIQMFAEEKNIGELIKKNIVLLAAVAAGCYVNGTAGLVSSVAALAIHYLSHWTGQQSADPKAKEEISELKRELEQKQRKIEEGKADKQGIEESYKTRNNEKVEIEANYRDLLNRYLVLQENEAKLLNMLREVQGLLIANGIIPPQF